MIKLKHDIPVRLFMNQELKAEKSALEELNQFLRVRESIETLREHDKDFISKSAGIQEVSITPDFHKGSGIPIGTTIFTKGFVIPQAIGNDINCGMRLYTTTLTEDDIRANIKSLEKKIRHVFFEGGRHIPMNNRNREALFKEGLMGILETHKNMNGQGIWKHYDEKQQEEDLSKVNKMGSFITNEAIGLEDFIGGEEISYDSQIGSIAGGNHFVEVQKVTKIKNSTIAKEWGIKEGQVVIMIHTGSVSIGHHSGGYFRKMMRDIYPNSLKQPDNGIYILPQSERFLREWQMFWSLLHNAANFAFANRLFLGLMAYKSLSEEIREFDFKLLYDAPHNYIWEEEIDGLHGFLHRKGSCTAKSAEQMQGTPFQYTGEPVFVPGSMGATSYIMAGLGNRESLFSASHGAGRKLSRGESVKVDDAKFREFMSRFHVITPIDPNRPDLRNRMDILQKWEEEVKKEAPYAYKDISPVIQTHLDNNMAQVVAEVEPIFTIKG